MTTPNSCPNDPQCPHPSLLHDVYEPGDLYPTCCAPGCKCGHPGEATLTRHIDGTVTVDEADPVIRVSRELLDQCDGRGMPWWDGSTLTLDTAGDYRYEYLRPDPADPERVLIFGRLTTPIEENTP